MAGTLLWLAVCAPLAVLLAWISDTSVLTMLGRSLLFAIPLTIWMWFSVQSANLYFKWPTLQLLGWTTVLISALILCTPLLLFLPAPATGFIALGLWLMLCAYGVFAAHKIHNKVLRISHHKIQSPVRFVQISDIHAGSRSRAFIQKCIEQALSHQPDAILITGDLLDSSEVDTEFLTPLKEITCPTWMCLGNHERYVDLQSAIKAIEANRVTVLRNDAQHFQNINIIGIDDADDSKQVEKQLPGITYNTNEFNVLLYHKPEGWQTAQNHHIDLMLSGHTHGGQVWPFGLAVKRQFPYLSGLFTNNSNHLYVSPGTGTWGPILRLGTRCEMTVIELTPAT